MVVTHDTNLGIRLIEGLILSVTLPRNLGASNLLCVTNGIPVTRAPHPITIEFAFFQTYTIHFYQNLRKLSSSIPLVILLSIMALRRWWRGRHGLVL